MKKMKERISNTIYNTKNKNDSFDNIPSKTENILQDISSACNKESIWTLGYLIDELYVHLVRMVDNEHGFRTRKYEDQARYLLYKIPIYRPVPEFVIYTHDLTERLKYELAFLSDKNLDYVIKEVIGKIFCNIDERYYFLSVRKLVQWRLE